VRGTRLGLVSVLSLMAACGKWDSQALPAGQLEAHWTGADSGKISALAAAEWCADRLSLEIRAVQGDTGLALALYAVDSVAADSYRVVEPSRADSAPPAARVALRLFSPTAIKGYQGDSGKVILERSGSGQLSGRLAARARSVASGEQIRLSGRFDGVAVMPQERGCAPERVDTMPPDTTEDPGQLHEQVD
jgi:hypothetical protein